MNNAIQGGLQEIDNVNLNSLNKQSGINILDPNDINRYRFQKDFDAFTFNPNNPYNEQNWINKESWGSALRKGFSGMGSRFSNTFVDYWVDYGRMVDALFSWDWSKMIKSPEEQYKAYYEDQQEMYKNYVFVPEEKRDAIFGKSGISEFISNAGFSLGTYTGFALELLADAAITIATIPAGGEGAVSFGATLGKFGAKLGMKSAAKATAKSAAKATAKSAAKKTTKAGQFFKGMYQYSHIDDFAKAVSSPNNFTRAQRNMVKDRFAALSFNIGGIAKSKSVGDFFLQVGKGLPYLGEAFRYGERMVKAGKAGYSGATLAGMGVMGLRRMAQEFNFASTESSFEAIQSYGTSLDMMLQDYKNKGYNIDEYDFNKMQELSFESSLKTYNTNLAILGLTNRIQFGTLFNKMPMHKTWLTRNIMGNSLEGIHTVSRKGVSKIYNTSGLFGGTRTLFKIGKDFGWRKAGTESIKLFGKDFLKFDLVEGLQEIMQETTSKAWADYYSNQYYNAEKSIGTAFGDALGSMWSKEGLKIFVHGAMAGGMIKIPTHVMNNILEYTQIKTTDRQYGKKENPYRQAKKRKQEDIDFLNDLMWTKDFNSSSISGLANALQNSIKMDEAAKNGNDYEWNNAKDNMLIQGIIAANRLGVDYAYIHAVETLGDDITIEEFNKMMGVDLDQTKYSTPKEFTSKIASQLRRYTDTVTKLRNEFNNKINPADFDPKSSNYIAAIITAKKQEEAINNIAILELQGERNLERIQKMKDEVSKLSGLETSSYYAFEILTNRERLNSELGEVEGRILTLENTLKAEGLTKDDIIATKKQLNILKERKAELTEWGNYFIKDKNGEYKFVGEKIENEGKVYYDPESNRVKEVFRNILNNKNKEEGFNEINDSVFKEASIKIYDIIRLSEQTRDISEQILSLQDPEKFMALVKRMEEGHLKFLMSGILQASFHTLDISLVRHFAKKWNLKEEDLIKQAQEEVKNGNIDFEFLGDDTTDLMRQEMLFEILMMMNPKFAEEYRNAKEDLFNQLEADKDYNELMKMLNSENINKDIDKFKTLLQTISEKINLFAKNTLSEISDKYREQLKEDLPESVTPENIEYDQIDHIAYKVFKGIELQKHEAELYKDKNVKERVDKVVEIFKKADEEKFTIKEDDPSVITEKEYKEAMEEDDKTGEDIDENDIVYLLNNPNKISAEKLFNIMRKKEKGEKLTDEEELLLSIDDDILLKKINEHRVKYIKGKNIYAVYNILNKYINSKKENKEVVLTNKQEEIVDYLGDQYFKELTKYENEIVSVMAKYDLLQNKKIKNITFTFNERNVLNLLGFDYFKAVINYKNIQREINKIQDEILPDILKAQEKAFDEVAKKLEELKKDKEIKLNELSEKKKQFEIDIEKKIEAINKLISQVEKRIEEKSKNFKSTIVERKISTELKALRDNIDSSYRNLQIYEDRLVTLINMRDKAETQEEKDNLLNQIKSLDNLIESIKLKTLIDRFNYYKLILKEEERDRIQSENRLNFLKKRLEGIKKLPEQYNEIISNLEKEESELSYIVEEQKAFVDELKNNLHVLKSKKHNTDIEALNILNMEMDIQESLERINDLESRIEKIGLEKDAYIGYSEYYTEQIKEDQYEIYLLEHNLFYLQESSEIGIKNLEQQIKDKYNKLKDSEKKQKDVISNLKDEKNDLEKQIKEINEDINKYKKQLSEINEKLQKDNLSKEQIKYYEKYKNNLEKVLQIKETSLNNRRNDLPIIVEKISTEQLILSDLQRSIEVIEAEQKYVEKQQEAIKEEKDKYLENEINELNELKNEIETLQRVKKQELVRLNGLVTEAIKHFDNEIQNSLKKQDRLIVEINNIREQIQKVRDEREIHKLEELEEAKLDLLNKIRESIGLNKIKDKVKENKNPISEEDIVQLKLDFKEEVDKKESKEEENPMSEEDVNQEQQNKKEIETQIAEIERGRQEELKRITLDELKKELKGYENQLIPIEDKIGNSFRIIDASDGELTIDYIKQDGTHSNFSIQVSEKVLDKYRNVEWSDADINEKHDAKYVDAVNKGDMTREQAMQALEEAGRKDSSAYAELAALEAHITSQQEQKVQQSAQKEVEETAEKIKQEQQELQKRNRVKASKSLQTIISNIADRTIKNINKLDSEQRKMLLNDYDLKNTFISLLTEKVYEYMDKNNINTITELKSNKEHMDNIETLGLSYLDNLLKEYDFINKDDIQEEQDITDKVEDGASNVDINQTGEVVESVVKSKDNISNEINNILEQKKDKENDRDAFLDVLRKIKNLKC